VDDPRRLRPRADPVPDPTRDKATPLATVDKELAALEFRIIDPTTEEGKELKTKAKADRSKAINAAFDRLAKTLREIRVSQRPRPSPPSAPARSCQGP
jgi:hypothetical protein